jgi:hypothetical protein
MSNEHVVENAPLPPTGDDEIIDDVQESQEFVEEEKLEEQPPESGTPTEAVDTPTEEVELTAQEKRFVELGLDKQFPGGIDQLIENMPKYNAAFTQTLQKRSQPEQQQVETKPPPVTDESFQEDPLTGVKTLLAQHGQTLAQQQQAQQQRMDQIEYDSFMASKVDSPQMLQSMIDISNNTPSLQTLPVREYMPILYGLAKAAQIPTAVAQAAQTAATTTPNPSNAEAGVPGKTERMVGEPSLQQLAAMSTEEMEKVLPRMKQQ